MDATLMLVNGLLSAMIFISVVNGQYSVKINLSSEKVRKGGNVTVTCDVINRLKTDVVRLSWVRKRGQQETVIASEGQLREEFRSSRGRYTVGGPKVDAQADSKRSIFTLTITGLQSSDSGEIGCFLPENHVEIFKTLTVQSPVQTMRLNSTDLDNTHATTYMDNQTMFFREGDAYRFSCSASGAYPEPTLRVYAGDRDITDAFRLASTLREEGPKASDGKLQAVDSLFYEVRRTTDRLNITHDLNRKRISCVAEVPGSEFPVNRTSIEVRLYDFCPKFECGDEVVAKPHESDVQLRCRVIGEPEVLAGSFLWKRKSGGNDLGIEAGKSDGMFTGYLNSKNGDVAVKEMVLRIAHMFPQHFRTYVFQAKNANCNSSKEITVRKDTSEDYHSGSTSLCDNVITTIARISMATVIIIIIISITTTSV